MDLHDEASKETTCIKANTNGIDKYNANVESSDDDIDDEWLEHIDPTSGDIIMKTKGQGE